MFLQRLAIRHASEHAIDPIRGFKLFALEILKLTHWKKAMKPARKESNREKEQKVINRALE